MDGLKGGGEEKFRLGELRISRPRSSSLTYTQPKFSLSLRKVWTRSATKVCNLLNSSQIC